MSSHDLRQPFERVMTHRLRITDINGEDATKDNDAVYCVKRPEKSTHPAKAGHANELHPGLIIAPRIKKKYVTSKLTIKARFF